MAHPMTALLRVSVLLGALALGMLTWPDGRGLALGGVAGALSLLYIERRPVRPYLPPRQIGRRRPGAR